MIEYIEENGKVILDVTGDKKVCHFLKESANFDFSTFDHLIDVGDVLGWLKFFLKQIPGYFRFVEPRNHQLEGEYTLIVKLFDETTYTLSLLDTEIIQESILNENNGIVYCNNFDDSTIFGLTNRIHLSKSLEDSYFDFSMIDTDLRTAVNDDGFLKYFETKMKDLGFNFTMNKRGCIVEDEKLTLPISQHGSGVAALYNILFFMYFYGKVKSETPKILFAPRIFDGLDVFRKNTIEKIIESDFNGRLLTA